ncbi:MAG: hemin uptake protein HemP [Pirellulaceae bacterium]
MCQIDENHEPKNPGSSPAESAKEPRMIDSLSLLQGARELYIRHRGEVYRLLETRNGKLILQK